MGGGGDFKAPNSDTSGVKPMNLAGRFASELERVHRMSDAERAWRNQYLKDQVLAPHEPLESPAMEKELYNPIRRFYKRPLDALGRALIPLIGKDKAEITRLAIPRLFFSICAIYLTYYHMKYNASDWTRNSGFTIKTSQTRSLPGEPDYPRVSQRKETNDYADKGFNSRKVFLD